MKIGSQLQIQNVFAVVFLLVWHHLSTCFNGNLLIEVHPVTTTQEVAKNTVRTKK